MHMFTNVYFKMAALQSANFVLNIHKLMKTLSLLKPLFGQNHYPKLYKGKVVISNNMLYLLLQGRRG